MSFDKQVAEVAARLSEAQRAALVAGRWNVGDEARYFLGGGLTRRIRSAQQPLLNLEITALGLAVRQHIQEQANVR